MYRSKVMIPFIAILVEVESTRRKISRGGNFDRTPRQRKQTSKLLLYCAPHTIIESVDSISKDGPDVIYT